MLLKKGETVKFRMIVGQKKLNQLMKDFDLSVDEKLFGEAVALEGKATGETTLQESVDRVREVTETTFIVAYLKGVSQNGQTAEYRDDRFKFLSDGRTFTSIDQVIATRDW